MPKKSKYNLNIYAHLKVPKEIYLELVEKYGEEDWAEGARDILRARVIFWAREEKKNEQD